MDRQHLVHGRFASGRHVLRPLQLAGPVQDVVWLGIDALLVVHAAGFQAEHPGTTGAGEWLQEIREDGSGTFTRCSDFTQRT